MEIVGHSDFDEIHLITYTEKGARTIPLVKSFYLYSFYDFESKNKGLEITPKLLPYYFVNYFKNKYKNRELSIDNTSSDLINLRFNNISFNISTIDFKVELFQGFYKQIPNEVVHNVKINPNIMNKINKAQKDNTKETFLNFILNIN
jgi:hypothetical protein